jgi:DNA-binding XRE family transcriptional regulator
VSSKLSTALRDRRIALGQEVSEVAAELRVSRQTYWSWEVSRSLPSDPHWSRLATYLGLPSWRDVEALLEPEPPAMPPAGGVE